MFLRISIVAVSISMFTGMDYGIAQSVAKADGEIFSTQATDANARPDAKKLSPKKERFRYIIKNNSKGTLKGNKCFEEVTHKYGFEYLIVPEDLPPNQSGILRFLHNTGTKFILFFRNGPFWQLKMKKKYRQCRYQYGDFVGSVTSLHKNAESAF